MSYLGIKGKLEYLIAETIEKYGYNPSLYKRNNCKSPVCFICLTCGDRFDGPLMRTYHKCKTVKPEENLKYCGYCNLWKDTSDFFKNAIYCKCCYSQHPTFTKSKEKSNKKQRESFIFNIDLYLRKKFESIKSRCKKRNILFAMTIQEFIESWEKSDGICHYTGIKMQKTFNQSHPAWNAPSIDKLVPERGYTKDNIVWCLFSVNCFKRELTKEQLLEKMKQIHWNLPEPEYYI